MRACANKKQVCFCVALKRVPCVCCLHVCVIVIVVWILDGGHRARAGLYGEGGRRERGRHSSAARDGPSNGLVKRLTLRRQIISPFFVDMPPRPPQAPLPHPKKPISCLHNAHTYSSRDLRKSPPPSLCAGEPTPSIPPAAAVFLFFFFPHHLPPSSTFLRSRSHFFVFGVYCFTVDFSFTPPPWRAPAQSRRQSRWCCQPAGRPTSCAPASPPTAASPR